MWGYGARHAALSTGKLDPLYASAVVVQAGEKKLAIVGLDLGRSPAEKTIQNIRARIKEKATIEYSFIAGSHTHHGPVLELTDEEGKGKGKFDAAIRYYQELEDGIVAAILEADAKLVPARLATGVVKLNGILVLTYIFNFTDPTTGTNATVLLCFAEGKMFIARTPDILGNRVLDTVTLTVRTTPEVYGIDAGGFILTH